VSKCELWGPTGSEPRTALVGRSANPWRFSWREAPTPNGEKHQLGGSRPSETLRHGTRRRYNVLTGHPERLRRAVPVPPSSSGDSHQSSALLAWRSAKGWGFSLREASATPTICEQSPSPPKTGASPGPAHGPVDGPFLIFPITEDLMASSNPSWKSFHHVPQLFPLTSTQSPPYPTQPPPPTSSRLDESRIKSETDGWKNDGISRVTAGKRWHFESDGWKTMAFRD
jgi:hypothetical protein